MADLCFPCCRGGRRDKNARRNNITCRLNRQLESRIFAAILEEGWCHFLLFHVSLKPCLAWDTNSWHGSRAYTKSSILLPKIMPAQSSVNPGSLTKMSDCHCGLCGWNGQTPQTKWNWSNCLAREKRSGSLHGHRYLGYPNIFGGGNSWLLHAENIWVLFNCLRYGILF
jgi:hypothetical protein